MARLQRLGVAVLVFGSGAARSVPDGFDRQTALSQLETALRLAAETGARHRVTVALEPLRAAETNLLNRVAETADFLREHDCGPARLVADLYHMREEGEPASVLQSCADLLVHAHVAGPERRPPRAEDADVDEFLSALRAAGYAGSLSLECRWEDFAKEAHDAVLRLRA